MSEQHSAYTKENTVYMTTAIFCIGILAIALGVFLRLHNNMMYGTALGIGFIAMFCNGVFVLSRSSTIKALRWGSVMLYIYGGVGVLTPVSVFYWYMYLSPEAETERASRTVAVEQEKAAYAKELVDKKEKERKDGVNLCEQRGCWNSATKILVKKYPGPTGAVLKKYYCSGHP